MVDRHDSNVISCVSDRRSNQVELAIVVVVATGLEPVGLLRVEQALYQLS